MFKWVAHDVCVSAFLHFSFAFLISHLKVIKPLNSHITNNMLHSRNIILMAAMAVLTGCHTVKSVVDTYDERPENRQPVLERPAWPNYDLHDDRSFAAFSHIQTATKGEGSYIKLEHGEGFCSMPMVVYRCKEATYVCLDYTVPEEQDWWFWRFTTGSAIIDAATGDRYLLQSVEHFPMDQCFWTYGQKNETIRFVLVYPPLPPSVKLVQFYEATAESRRWMSGAGSLTMPINIDGLRPGWSSARPAKKQGRIIR